jgi:protein phosphatase
MMTSRFSLEASAGTHPGQLREINQDNVLAFVRSAKLGDAMGLLIVADGMGGHQAGEVASQLAVDTIQESLAWMLEEDDSESTDPLPTIANEELSDGSSHLSRRLEIAVQEANKAIYEYALENPVEAGNLGCTLTCALIFKNVAVIGNVGDSRTYLLNDGELRQVTDDHSYVWQLASEGHIELKDIFDHPQRNVITRALGNAPEVEVDLWFCELDAGDRLLLCSDGVWEMIRDQDEIASLLKTESLELAVDHLIEAANRYGGTDNIGVVVAELQ